jgi:phage baseplate assembly protein W
MSIEKRLISRTVVPSAARTTIVGSRAYKGISTVSGTSKFALYDIDLIKQDIINHFHIRQGEKLENPEFGTIIWDLLFEPLTEDVKSLIVQNVTEIINYDPRVKVESITVSQYESGLQIECELTYLPYNISESLRYRFDQDNSILG